MSYGLYVSFGEAGGRVPPCLSIDLWQQGDKYILLTVSGQATSSKIQNRERKKNLSDELLQLLQLLRN